MDGCVFDIQRFSVHDGPGIRTTVFLKGCPLHCLWCSNPESQHSAPEMLFNEELCIGCDSCVQACPSGAIEPGRFLPERCTGCGACCEVCYAEARFQKGQRMTPEAVLETA
ncbi:MAG: 4Fe-4S binding protein, partial [Clostridiales bacterium]|nr:4Fe-4S binding protein [Clostridiales bacterium]